MHTLLLSDRNQSYTLKIFIRKDESTLKREICISKCVISVFVRSYVRGVCAWQFLSSNRQNSCMHSFLLRENIWSVFFSSWSIKIIRSMSSHNAFVPFDRSSWKEVQVRYFRKMKQNLYSSLENSIKNCESHTLTM